MSEILSKGKILVTGSNGFIGKHLCREMSLRGLRFKTVVRSTNEVSGSQNQEQVVVGDLLNFSNWSDLFKDVEIVIHLAAKVHEMRQVSPELYERQNVELTRKLAEESKKFGVKRFIFLSTVKVNGESTTTPFKESDEPNPTDPYSKSKLAAEKILLHELMDSHFEVVIVRPPLVYGRDAKANFSRLVKLVRSGFPLPFTMANNKRSFISADNLSDFLIHCSYHPSANGRVFLVSDGDDKSTKELVQCIGEVIGQPVKLIAFPMDTLFWILKTLGLSSIRDRLFTNLQVDITEAKKILGWKPPFSVVESLRNGLTEFTPIALTERKSKPKVAVLVATFNGSTYIEEQIRSIEMQAGVMVDIYVSDDSSTDHTVQIIESMSLKNLKIIQNKMGGGSASQNFFKLLSEVDFEKYDFIALSDQDDIWLREKLISSISALEKSNADGVSSDVITFWDASKKQSYLKKSSRIGAWNHFFESPGPGCTFVITKSVALAFKNLLNSKKELIQKVDYHDWLLFAFVRSTGRRWEILPFATMLYRQHSQNVIGANAGFKSVLKRLRLIHNGWYRSQTLLIAQICDSNNLQPIQDLKNKIDLGILFRLIQNRKEFRRRAIDQALFVYILIIYWITDLFRTVPTLDDRD